MALGNIRNSLRNAANAGKEDIGFGSSSNTSSIGRFINKDGSYNVIRRGRGAFNLYQWLVEMPWKYFIILMLSFYLIINLIYATLFFSFGIENTLKGLQFGTPLENFGHAFFFSIQTFTTVGYGTISPNNLAGNIIASLDALTGTATLALATGLLFARFSKPVADILYSSNALIAPYQGGKALMFRIANMRNSRLYDVEAQVTLSHLEKDAAGAFKRAYITLPLERSNIVLFPLSWTIVYPIDEESILYNKSMEDIVEMGVELLAVFKGFDEAFAQTIHSNGSYTAKEILFDHRFTPMFQQSEDGQHIILDFNKIDDVVKV